nr:transient receptor potential cation channel trpm isoform X8 [Drosophila kikkawai]
MWNPCDGAAIILFLIGLAFRFRDTTMDIGRVIYCVDSIYWYLRILNILGVNKYLGPLVTMMGKMVKNMIYFVVLLAVVLMSFGVSRQAILYPDKQPTWGLIKEVTFQPYFMLYGEVFAGDIDPPCGEDPSQPGCVTGHWVTPITMSMYLLIANILLINLLIAVFNNIFNEVNSVSHQVWMFQRFTVVMEYQQKPVLPPPFIALCHFYSLLKYCVRKAKGLEVQRDNGLKLFLEKDDLERLYDFEEECVEGFFHEQEIILNQSTDERVKNTTERVETMSQKIEDINQKENIQTATVQNIEFRLRKMEESSEQILSHLAVIHRFMSTHIAGTDDLRGSTINIPSEMHRMRTISISDTEGGGNGSGGAGGGGSGSGGGGGAIVPLALGAGLNLNSLQVTTRRRFNRSLTEVRPDAYIFDEGTHFEVVPLPEEPDEVVKSREALNEQVVRKASMQSEADSDIYLPLSQRPSTCETVKRTPYVTVRQDTGASTESKDTLTPMGNDDDQTLVGGDNSDDAAPDINFEAARHRALRQRTVSLCRRNSETYSLTGADFNRSHISLNQLASLSRRQMSLTQSEPDSDKDMPAAAGGSSSAHPGKSVLHAKPSRNILLKLHSEYTSITDELESVCHMIASPTVSLQSNKASLDRPKTEMSRAEAAALLEKKHLKECEENDYKILEGLIEARGSIDASAQPFEIGVSIDYSHRYPLRRETAVELSPSKPSVEGDLMGGATGGAASGGGGDSSDTSGAGSCGAMVVVSSGFQLKNERPWQRNSSMEQQTYPSPLVPTRATSDFLNPPYEGSGRLFKKSSESLQKNSSTETDYSAHPYRFIKQSSNETNTSLTGSYNVDTPSLTAEPSLDAGDSHSATGISISVGAAGGAATARYQPIRTASVGAADGRRLRDESSSSLDLSSGGTTGPVTMQAAPAPPSRPMLLKKQFSVDQGKPSQPAEATATATGMATATAQTPEPAQVGAKLISTLKPQPFASKLGMNVLKESSSSTEESGCSSAKSSNPALSIPQISTHLVQDEIAKLSSNIKSSTESEKDPPFNETMC